MSRDNPSRGSGTCGAAARDLLRAVECTSIAEGSFVFLNSVVPAINCARQVVSAILKCERVGLLGPREARCLCHHNSPGVALSEVAAVNSEPFGCTLPEATSKAPQRGYLNPSSGTHLQGQSSEGSRDITLASPPVPGSNPMPDEPPHQELDMRPRPTQRAQ